MNDMKCDKDKTWVVDWLNNELDEKDRKAFEIHLKECSICRQELQEAEGILNGMETINIPEPSPDMESRFSALTWPRASMSSSARIRSQIRHN